MAALACARASGSLGRTLMFCFSALQMYLLTNRHFPFSELTIRSGAFAHFDRISQLEAMAVDMECCT